MQNIRLVLEENDLSFSDIYKLRVWLKDISQMTEANNIIAQYLPKQENGDINVAITFLSLEEIPRREALIEIDFETFRATNE